MPWKEDGPMELRIELIQEWEEGESITALAEGYGVARKTIYKWIERPRQRRSGGTGRTPPSAAQQSPEAERGNDRARHPSAAALGLGTTQAAGEDRRSMAGRKAPFGQHGGRAVA